MLYLHFSVPRDAALLSLHTLAATRSRTQAADTLRSLRALALYALHTTPDSAYARSVPRGLISARGDDGDGLTSTPMSKFVPESAYAPLLSVAAAPLACVQHASTTAAALCAAVVATSNSDLTHESSDIGTTTVSQSNNVDSTTDLAHTSSSNSGSHSNAYPPSARVRLGFHALPSLPQLHLHVISQDFSSQALKNKQHYLSYTSPFFLPVDAVIAAVDGSGGCAGGESVAQQQRCDASIRGQASTGTHGSTDTRPDARQHEASGDDTDVVIVKELSTAASTRTSRTGAAVPETALAALTSVRLSVPEPAQGPLPLAITVSARVTGAAAAANARSAEQVALGTEWFDTILKGPLVYSTTHASKSSGSPDSVAAGGAAYACYGAARAHAGRVGAGPRCGCDDGALVGDRELLRGNAGAETVAAAAAASAGAAVAPNMPALKRALDALAQAHA